MKIKLKAKQISVKSVSIEGADLELEGTAREIARLFFTLLKVCLKK